MAYLLQLMLKNQTLHISVHPTFTLSTCDSSLGWYKHNTVSSLPLLSWCQTGKIRTLCGDIWGMDGPEIQKNILNCHG